MTLYDLFPAIEPYAIGMMPVDEIHTLYWEESGNPEGLPVLFLHGGPGAGSNAMHRTFFDPKIWRIVIFDQRGAGRSTPRGDIRNNTTELLIQDIEQLRTQLCIEKWHIFGGSWGSTLSVAYGEAHPERCLGFVLRGIFMMRKQEIEWFASGLRNVFPEPWERFASLIPPQEQDDLIGAYLKRLQDPDEAVRKEARIRMIEYETSCSSLTYNPQTATEHAADEGVSAMALMEAHYMKNNVPSPDTKFLDEVDLIRHLPCIIVQGRYDMICPIVTANELHKRWPDAHYVIVNNAGHSAFEPGIRSALIEATEKMKTISA
jgi:proline iminopeptidase